MRIIVRGNSASECEKKAKSKAREGWKAITDVKIDYSSHYGDSYVCVMEKPTLTEDQDRWNRPLPK